ncbi:MAG: DNA repair protein RadA [Patescibacteria group bacterium]|nr:DNA repair protein RadA [Patescibacteria group bacterium]
MAKNHSEIFSCTNCDSQFPKWQGRCSECGQWGTLAKTQAKPATESKNKISVAPGKVIAFTDIKTADFQRLKTGLNEIDRVLGGGLVNGSLILLGGEPGIGKSTIVLQICSTLNVPILYVSGEESGSQIKTRLDRLKIKSDQLKFLGETNVETIVSTIVEQKPKFVIIDSIQTIHSAESPSGAGSVNQVRISTTKLLEVAKQNDITILIIGHVTKDGDVGGPKTLEHLVDVVLYLEGDQFHTLRILRGAKNRFGSTSEVGIFEMRSNGLTEVSDPAAIFLGDKQSTAGSIIAPVLEGSRIFLLEVQALVNQTNFGYPQRRSSGFDLNRLQLLVAALSQRSNIKLMNQDIYLNLVGGLKVTEPAIDLPVCLAVASALKNKIISSDLAAFGEVGLGGEIRPVTQIGKRLTELHRLGFKTVIMPKIKEKINSPKMTLQTVANLTEALKLIE